MQSASAIFQAFSSANFDDPGMHMYILDLLRLTLNVDITSLSRHQIVPIIHQLARYTDDEISLTVKYTNRDFNWTYYAPCSIALSDRNTIMFFRGDMTLEYSTFDGLRHMFDINALSHI